MTTTKPDRDAAADAGSEPVEPERAGSLFELDAPRSSASGAAAVSGKPPANRNAAPSELDSILDAEELRRVEADAAALDIELLELADSPALPDSDAAALSADELVDGHAAIPNESIRAAVAAPEVERFDTLLDPSPSDPAADPRVRLSWRFKATSAAYRMLGPLSTLVDRRELVALLRKYELSLRAAAVAPPAGTKQITDALHLALPATAIDELERALGKVEDKLLAIDETIADEAFRIRWTKEREAPKTLLRYARLLAARRFNIGYRRDRFEALAHELLTAKTSSGALVLMPRAKAAPVLLQLLRGLSTGPVGPEERAAARAYLHDALERLKGLSGAKPFFDSGFFLDVHGYKVSMHAHVTNAEFLYLCVALNVEVHNCLHRWSRSSASTDSARGSAPPLAALQAQLRAQEQAVQAVFANFRKPRDAAAVGAPATKKPARTKPTSKPATSGGVGVLGFVAACLFLLVGVGASLFATDVVRLHAPPETLAAPELHALSPLLVQGKLSAKRTRFDGKLSRPAWQRLAAKERRAAAETLAKNLERIGIHHGSVFAYKARAIEVEFGGVTYVDDAK